MIYTRSGGKTRFLNRKDGSITFKGFNKTLNSEYDMGATRNRIKNYKGEKTLYWNPELKTDENGEVIFSFIPAESDGGIKIKALAIDPEGRVVRLESLIESP